MKRKITALVATLFCLSTTTSATPAIAGDWSPGEGMANTMLVNLALGKSIEEKSEFGFCDTCYLAAYIEPGKDAFITTELEAGRAYLFGGAVGEESDLDIIVQNSNGDQVARDTQKDNIPIVEFTPNSTAQYTIRLKLFSASSARFCSMILMQKGGWALPADNLGRAGGLMLQRCRDVASKVPARFLQETGEWAVVGRVMNSGTVGTLSDMRFGSGRRVVVAGGDSKTRDIDLAIFENNNTGDAIDSDKLPDDNPILDFRTSSDNRYRLVLENPDSNGATVVMTAILDVD